MYANMVKFYIKVSRTYLVFRGYLLYAVSYTFLMQWHENCMFYWIVCSSVCFAYLHIQGCSPPVLCTSISLQNLFYCIASLFI